MIFKYIIIKEDKIPILFPKRSLSHANVALGLGEVISAGFCIIKNQSNGKISVKCFGSSSTLNIKSDVDNDKLIIEKILNNNEI